MAISNEIEKLERRWQQTSGLVFAPLAEAYRKAGLHDRALEVLQQGLSLHPDYGPALIVRGRCHLDSGNLSEAETAFDQALGRDPMDPIAIRGIADVFARTGRVPDAIERLQTLVDIDPRNAEARAALQRLQQQPLSLPDVAVSSRAHLPVQPPPVVRPPEPTPAPSFTAAPQVAAEPPAPAPAIEEPALEMLSLDAPPPAPPPVEAAPVEAAPVAAAPVNIEDFRVESFAVEPLGPPADLEDSPAVDEFSPITWTPAPPPQADAAESTPLSLPEAEPEASVAFSPAPSETPLDGFAPTRFEPPPVVESEPMPELVAQERFEAPAPVVSEVTGPVEEPVMQAPVSPEPEPLAPAAMSEPWTESVVPEIEPAAAEIEPAVAEPTVEQYASATMPPSTELDTFAPPAAEPEVAPEPEPVVADATDAPASYVAEDPVEPPALIVTESMAELFLKQGHRELAFAVYRQLTERGPVSDRLRVEMERIEQELSSRPAPVLETRVYSARATGGRSVESWLQSVLQAQPPSPASSVLPPAIEPATGEPTRATADTLPLSAVFGDEPPVVAPKPELTSTPEPSFDEFFGAVPAPEPTPAGGGERSAEAEDLRQFNEWLKGLKR